MQTTASGTNYSIEFMRIAGVILITFTHIRHNFTDGTVYFIFEILPKYGTLLLSIISGYLYCASGPGTNLLNKKIKSLLIPYLIANLAVILPVVIINFLGYNFLNRLSYDSTLITNGLFALRDAPVNPPTYFIRDLFVIFCLLSLLQKDYRALIFLIPLLLFGTLFIRWDIPVLFIVGFLIKKFSFDTVSYSLKNMTSLPFVVASFFLFTDYGLYKYAIALLFFINFVDFKFTFIKTGAYTYLLHLYHCPIAIFIYPILNKIYPNPYFEAIGQIIMAITSCYILYLIVKRFNLRFISGNR